MKQRIIALVALTTIGLAMGAAGARVAGVRAFPPAQPLSETPHQPSELPPGHPPVNPDLPPGHPPVPGLPPGHPPLSDPLPPGHPTAGQRPLVAADPEDVRSIDSIVAAYYDVLSAPPETDRDWDRFRSLFAPESRLIAAQPLGENRPCAVMSPDQFIQLNSAYFRGSGYFETDIHRRVERFGNAAHVFSTYETRTSMTAEPYSRGINSIQLVHDGGRWWIATILWDFERPDNPIPPEYLPSPEVESP